MNDLQASLSALLKALGEGVVQSSKLPVDDEFEFEKSFPEFAKQLSGTQRELVQLIKEVLVEVNGSRLMNRPNDNDENDEDDIDNNCDYDVYDAAFWERCEDACEYLLDQLENTQASKEMEVTKHMLNQLGHRAQLQGQTAFSRMQSNLVDMVKPQGAYHMRPPNNSRTDPFVPPISTKPNALVPLDLTLQPGHGLEGRFPVRESGNGGLGTHRYASSRNLIAPAFYVPHPYQTEIEQFPYQDWQLEVPPNFSSKLVERESEPLHAEWIDTKAQLENLVRDLHHQQKQQQRLVVAIDLEAHGWRSFSGMTCLMQLSYKKSSNSNSNQSIKNYLIDTLQLQADMHLLLPILTDPTVVKVMHGADSDVLWLQRDFGLYVVNLFDTGRAARTLQLPSASYAHLLHRYVGIAADKSHQLADWRQRPLSDEMRQYAIQDTHYLLDIYDRLKADLKTPDRIRTVLDVSRLVCLSRYAVEPFDPEGYTSLTSHGSSQRRRGGGASGNTRQDLDDVQERVLKRLWDWRDRAARNEDESVNYVCPKSALLRLALAARQLTNLRALQALFNPMPSPLILQHADEILGLVQRELQQNPTNDKVGEKSDVQPSSGAEPAANQLSSLERTVADDAMRKAVEAEGSQQQPGNSFATSAFLLMKRRNNGMSPILGTDDLYRQAGWMTPHEKLRALATTAGATSSSSSAGEETVPADPSRGANARRSVSVHPSNKNYQASAGSNVKASNEPNPTGDSKATAPLPQSRTVDGMATVRAAKGDAAASNDTNLEEELKRAKNSSSAVQAKLRGSLPSVLGLVTPIIDLDEDEAAIEDGRESRVRGDPSGGQEDEDFVIPRSMREIYAISNRNRRNKKAGSPTPERGVTPTTEKEREELARAEAVLKEHGLIPSPYFDDGPGSPGKRAKTKTSSGRESEETVPQDSAAMASREDDFAVLKSIGWMPEGVSAAKAESDPGKHATYGFDYSAAVDPKQPGANPFFAGAALVGGPLTQGFSKPDQRSKKPNPGRGKQQGRRQERPKKEEGRTHAYRKR
jgi:exosome complex exonuclease RRP6